MRRKPHPRGAGSLASDFGLIGQAFAEALHGLAAGWRQEICCPNQHYAGWR
jgi:hypothetical protein